MQATIQKWGNSRAIRLPKAILETACIEENEQVKIIATHSKITIKKLKSNRTHIPLAERIKNWNRQPYELTDEDREWLDMEPAGEEVW
ncbi:MAG: AbrB/MazE/SpoVT family DNA-binding domain-containing protein [Defluviitaleaceae bacterium]|nr:AbrB/MazE/SpoVT family DNA-binding domain-containing protein [Defluviitaleaceae bacterium]